MLFAAAAVATAQVSVKGRVTDSDGVAITGVIVLAGVIAPTTVTDLNGEFNLTINSNQEILRFLHPGYRAVSLPLNGITFIELVMMKDVANNDEMVVTALGLKRNKKSLPTPPNKFQDWRYRIRPHSTSRATWPVKLQA